MGRAPDLEAVPSTIGHLAGDDDELWRLALPPWFEQRAPKGSKTRFDKRAKRTVAATWRPVWDPLQLNGQHGHWRPRADAIDTVRGYVELEAGPRRRNLPHGEHLTVRLHYLPGTVRSRDGGNLAPLQKAAVDGLARGPRDWRWDKRRGWVRIVGLDLVPDDTATYVTDLTPAILPPADAAYPALWLDVIVHRPYRPAGRAPSSPSRVGQRDPRRH